MSAALCDDAGGKRLPSGLRYEKSTIPSRLEFARPPARRPRRPRRPADAVNFLFDTIDCALNARLKKPP
ncbi:hypothetical protein EVAR_14651_1 [Eumeta japonica]|uniref:Uncharacterized protein n=1 Tax=Eumeta variegata TaxID=151549 RepID=A0A4C1U267_EUMVA|nr:hypothetical protein EVAR_14651_1 [Eumeta japonica]